MGARMTASIDDAKAALAIHHEAYRQGFLAGARAMRGACADAAEVCDSPYAVPTPEEDDVCTAMSLRIAATIRAIDPAALAGAAEGGAA